MTKIVLSTDPYFQNKQGWKIVTTDDDDKEINR